MTLGALVIIVVGILVVNYFKSRDEGTIGTSLTTQNQVAQTPTQGKSYTVKEGDTLWAISEEVYGDGFSWNKIAEENKVVDANKLETGQTLSIPEVIAAATPAPAPETITVTEPVAPTVAASPEPVLNQAQTQSSEPISAATYTIMKGDNLWTISVRAYGDGYKWTQVCKENKLANCNLIYTGNTLILPR